MATTPDPQPPTVCNDCAALDATTYGQRIDDRSFPTRWWHCGKCNTHLERYRGGGDVSCDCGAQYNAFGQRLRDDWHDNPSNSDDEIGDLEGFEISQLSSEAFDA